MNAELEPHFQKNKGGVVLQGEIVKDDSWADAVFTEQGSSASQMMSAKEMDVTARLTECDGQAGCLKIGKKSEVWVSWCLDTSSKTQMAEIVE